MLSPGTPAPEFTLATDDGGDLALSSLRGRWVVLFFYPKDDTPGCTAEACEFRDALPRFDGLEATVLGISPDDVKSHRKFRDKFQIPYPLLADTAHAVAEAYGVWQEKQMYGRKYWGNVRTTYVIAPDGTIAHVFEKVKPEGHAAQVMALLEEQRAAR